MNKSQMAKLAAAAGVNGLMYDPNAEGVFGNVQGYTVTVMPNVNNRVYYMLSLSVSRQVLSAAPPVVVRVVMPRTMLTSPLTHSSGVTPPVTRVSTCVSS